MATSSSVGSNSFSEERERTVLKEEESDNKSWKKIYRFWNVGFVGFLFLIQL